MPWRGGIDEVGGARSSLLPPHGNGTLRADGSGRDLGLDLDRLLRGGDHHGGQRAGLGARALVAKTRSL